MEALALLPTDLAALANPLARPGAAEQGPLGVAGGALPGAEGFADLLAFLTTPLAGGQELPVDGNPLPLALPETALDGGEALAEEAIAESPVDAGATTAALAVWLAVRGEPAASAAGAVGAAETAAALPGARPASPAPSGAPRPPFPPIAGTTLGGVAPSPEALAPPAAAAGHSDTTPIALESMLPATETPAGEVHAAPSLEDELPRSEVALAGFADRAVLRQSSAPTPTSMPASTATAAAWLPPAGDAALQAAVRSADTSTVAPRSLRRGDASHFVAGPVPALADAAPAAAAEWLPPVATPGAAAPSPTAASAPSALPQAPVDTSAPRWHEAFAGRVQWLVDQRVGEARIKLNPPELGAVDVKISLVEDKTYVQLTAATAAARDELAQSLPRLRELFTASGLELGGASVHGGGRGGHAGAGGGGGGYDPAPRYGADLPALELPVPPERGRPGLRAAGAIDVFA